MLFVRRPGICEIMMKNPRKARQWRNALILQAAVSALFFPFVVSLAMMVFLAGHENRPMPTIDRTTTSSTSSTSAR
ncbi:MAG: hypothetical protein ACTHJQ_13290 [Rhizobiaceae bacterium]|jgi:hypothetical protein|nr:hypothetical protein [Hyphomicrobiales bacterium]